MAKSPTADEGFGKLLGIEMVERDASRSLCHVHVSPKHLNPHGVLHGGVMYSMADQGMGAAVYSVLEEDESCATIDVKMVYLAPVRDGLVECESRVINKTRRLAVLESEVRNAGRLVAKALGTFAIFPARP